MEYRTLGRTGIKVPEVGFGCGNVGGLMVRGSLDEQVEALIEKRNEARAGKDFATSDKIRDQLLEMGIILEDTPQGVRWKKKV